MSTGGGLNRERPPSIFTFEAFSATLNRMDYMNIQCQEYRSGRRLLARLASGRDIITAVADLCRETSINMASYVITGAVSAYTIGVFDQRQQVYVTAHESQAGEIVMCHGHVSFQEDKPFVYGHIALSHENGQMTGGRLFSDTLVFVAEIDLQELKGEVLQRSYDPSTGRLLWHF
jgi:predicted DNA-binding protein with PD1-like motif